MKTSIKMRDLTLKNILIILTYGAILVLGVIYFENGESCLVSKAKQKEIVAKMLVPKSMAV